MKDDTTSLRADEPKPKKSPENAGKSSSGDAQINNSLVGTIPRIRKPIQLAAFVFTLLSAFLIKRADPGNIESVAIIGSIGVAILAISLTFNPAIIKLLSPGHRVPFLLGMIALVLASFATLATVTYKSIQPEFARFDTKITPNSVKLFPREDGTARLQVGITFYPLSQRADQGSTIFTGIVTIHDEDSIPVAGLGSSSDARCDQSPSCLGAIIPDELSMHPLLVRSDADSVTQVFTIDLKRVPKHIRIWWMFYQKEGYEGLECQFDNNRLQRADAVPPLGIFKQGQRVSDCYASRNQWTTSTNVL